MNTRVLTSWLMIICPIGMMITFAGLDPLIMGEIAEGLGPNEEVLAGLVVRYFGISRTLHIQVPLGLPCNGFGKILLAHHAYLELPALVPQV